MGVKHIVALVVLAAIWGGSFMFMRVAAPEFGIYALVEFRTVLATLVLLPFLLATGDWRNMFRDWKPIALVGAINTAIPFVLFNYGSLHLEAGVLAILNATAPMFGALVAYFWLKDRLTPVAVGGLILGFAGVAVISQQKVGSGEVSFLPILTVLIATACYGLAASMIKKWLTTTRPLTIATGSQLMASVLLLPFALTTLPDSMPSTTAWLNATALAVGGTGIAYILYFYLIGSVGPAKAITVAYLVPLFGIFWGLVFLNETLSAQAITGGIMILIGVALTTGAAGLLRQRHKRGKVPGTG